MSETEKYIKFKLHDAEYETLPTTKYLQHKAWKAPNEKMLLSQIPGQVLDIFVKKGQKVKEGETVVLIEAMKMNNLLSFPLDGVVKTIHVKKGDIIAKNVLLVELK